jgi:hypothetical protein
MSTPVERIPIPWPQRRELLRERALPIVCFMVTLAACAALWRYQAGMAPVAIGEVHSNSVVINSPCDGELLPLVDPAEGSTDAGEVWRTFAEIESGQIAARVQCSAADAQIIEVPAPISGQITTSPARLGQLLRQGDHILTIASPDPDFIVCHVPDRGRVQLRAGQRVAIRRQQSGARWYATTVEAVGAVVEPGPNYNGSLTSVGERGLPVRIALPKGVKLTPGSLVDVRFPPASAL